MTTTQPGIPIPEHIEATVTPVQPRGTGAARIIVFGNEKGGSGKSTCCMHAVVGLLRASHTVGTIDVDPRQATLTRYLENRAILAETRGISLPMPAHRLVVRSEQGNEEDTERFLQALDVLSRSCDTVVIDTPAVMRRCRAWPIPMPTRWSHR